MRPKELIVLALLAFAAVGGGFYAAWRYAAGQPTLKPSIVELYLDVPARGASPLGVHVADVAVDGNGASLWAASDPQVKAQLTAALAQLSAEPSLTLVSEELEGSGARAAHALKGDVLGPRDPRYAWAVAGYLRERTGLNYRVVASSRP